jgi:hypothetical protein
MQVIVATWRNEPKNKFGKSKGRFSAKLRRGRNRRGARPAPCPARIGRGPAESVPAGGRPRVGAIVPMWGTKQLGALLPFALPRSPAKLPSKISWDSLHYRKQILRCLRIQTNGFLTCNDRALVIDRATGCVEVALRDRVPFCPGVHIRHLGVRMKRPRAAAGLVNG